MLLSRVKVLVLLALLAICGPVYATLICEGGSTLLFPAGVSLQAEDGECFGTWGRSCTRTAPGAAVQTHNFYGGNKYTFATSAPNGAFSMDDPRFFQVFDDFGCRCLATSDVNALTSIYINGSTAVTGDTDVAVIAASSLYMIPGGATQGSIGGPSPEWPPTGSTLANLVGITQDEPCCINNIIQLSIHNTLDSYQAPSSTTKRAWMLTLTWQDIETGAAVGSDWPTRLSQTYTSPSGIVQNIGGLTADIYWFGDSSGANGFYNDTCPGIAMNVPMNAGAGSTGSADICRRGSHYGQMIDVERSWANLTNTGSGDAAFGLSGITAIMPLQGFVENNPPPGCSCRIPLPAEMNWAVWSSIIHGARGINYFWEGFNTTVQSGQTRSLQTQAPITNLLIKQLAPVLHSPFAIGFATATPHGYTFPTYEQNWMNGGIETSVHWYNDGTVTNAGLVLSNGFYILSDTRYGETSGSFPLTATFTVQKYAGMNTTVQVVGQGRSRSLSCGPSQCTFTDTINAATDVNIYGPI
jgi:hypothetical protein